MPDRPVLPDSPTGAEEAPVADVDWKLVASRIWGILLHRLTPQQAAALARIHHVHPTTRELASYLEVSQAQASNLTTALFREGLIRRDKAGRTYRYTPAFPPPLPFHYFDRSPINIEGEAAEHALEILRRRGKL